MPIFYSWYSKNEKTNRSIEPTYNKQTPFNHNHSAITILLRSNDLILVKQPAKPIHDTFLKTVVSANEKPITVSKTIPCNLQWTNFFPPNCVRIFSSIDLEQSALIDINMYIELINVINQVTINPHRSSFHSYSRRSTDERINKDYLRLSYYAREKPCISLPRQM